MDERQWSVEGGVDEWLRLIEFIEPDCEPVAQVIAKAKDRAPNGEFPAYVVPSGNYKTEKEIEEATKRQVEGQVKAIYEALQDWGIGYAVERWDSQPSHQVIRTHDEVLKRIGGPCLDLVLLMAACLVYIGVQPLVIVLEEQSSSKRHAILAYRLKELILDPRMSAESFPYIEIDERGKRVFGLLDEEKLRRLKEREEIGFVDCTGFTKGDRLSFHDACKQGLSYVEHWRVKFALDVKVARETALTREMIGYLERVLADVSTLPPAFGFPPDVKFSDVWIGVKVRKGLRRFSEAEARAREKARLEGSFDEEVWAKAYSYPWGSPEDEEEREWPLDWDREVSRKVKRAVILGDPGFGKTWLLKHEAWKIAEETLGELGKYPLAPYGKGQIRLPIFVPLAELAEQIREQDQARRLEEALLDALKTRGYLLGRKNYLRSEGERSHRSRLEDWILENLDSDQCILLLDALDEVPQERRETLYKALDAFARKNDRGRILLTSRIVGYAGPPFPLPKEGEFELLPFDYRQQRKFVKVWFSGRPEKGDLFLRKLRGSPQLRALGGVPLLLAMMCRLFDEREELPPSRAELYEACVRGILTRNWKTPRQEDAYFDAKLELLEELAFSLFVEGKTLFSLRDLRKSISEILERYPHVKADLKRERERTAVDLIDELEEDGLLIKAGTGHNPRYLFLHLTFHEYLTACALTKRTALMEFLGERLPQWAAFVCQQTTNHYWIEPLALLPQLVGGDMQYKTWVFNYLKGLLETHSENPWAVAKLLIRWAETLPNGSSLIADVLIDSVGWPEQTNGDIIWQITIRDFNITRFLRYSQRASYLVEALGSSQFEYLDPSGLKPIAVGDFLLAAFLMHPFTEVREAAGKALSLHSQAPTQELLVEWAVRIIQRSPGIGTPRDVYVVLKTLGKFGPQLEQHRKIINAVGEFARKTLDGYAFDLSVGALGAIGGIDSAVEIIKTIASTLSQEQRIGLDEDLRSLMRNFFLCEVPEEAMSEGPVSEVLSPFEQSLFAIMLYLQYGLPEAYERCRILIARSRPDTQRKLNLLLARIMENENLRELCYPPTITELRQLLTWLQQGGEGLQLPTRRDLH